MTTDEPQAAGDHEDAEDQAGVSVDLWQNIDLVCDLACMPQQEHPEHGTAHPEIECDTHWARTPQAQALRRVLRAVQQKWLLKQQGVALEPGFTDPWWTAYEQPTRVLDLAWDRLHRDLDASPSPFSVVELFTAVPMAVVSRLFDVAITAVREAERQQAEDADGKD